MLRSKIRGPDPFTQTAAISPPNTNYDMGHFSIGPGELTATVFEEISLPPKYVWIKAQVCFEPCRDVPVFRPLDSFVWKGDGRCRSVKLTASQLLYAQKDYEVDKCWTLSKNQPVFEHNFALSSTLYARDEGIHLWPCGGRIGNVSDLEQLFAQVPSDGEQIYVNSFSAWKSFLSDVDGLVFEPPPSQPFNIIGNFTALIEQNSLEYTFTSCRYEATDTFDFINILCERKNI